MLSKNWEHNPGGLKTAKSLSCLIFVWLSLCQCIDFATTTSISTNINYLEAIPGLEISKQTCKKSCIAIAGTIFHKRLHYNHFELINRVQVSESVLYYYLDGNIIFF